MKTCQLASLSMAGAVLVALSLALPVAANDDPIVVGAPIPITGPYASDGEAMQQALELAVQKLNEDGGLLGRPVELLVFDIGDLTPDKLEAAGSFLVSRNEADVLINGYGGMGPDIPVFCAFDQPYINNNATSNVVELQNRLNCTNIFMGSDIDVNYGKEVFRQISGLNRDFGAKRIALLHGPYDWEVNFAEGVREAAAAAGWEMAYDAEIPYENNQWSGIIQQVKAANPTLVIVETLDTVGASTFVDQYTIDPVKGALLYAGYVFSTPGFEEIIESGRADGVLGMAATSYMPGQASKDFFAAWEAKFGVPPPFSMGAAIYDAVMIWADAVEAVGKVEDYVAVNEAIRKSRFEGLAGIYQWNPDQYITLGDNTLPAHLLQAQNGAIVQITIGSESTAPFVEPKWAK